MTGLLYGNLPMTDEFPSHTDRDSNAENDFTA